MTWADLATRAAGLTTHLLPEPALVEIEAAAEPAALAAALDRAGWPSTAGGGPARIEQLLQRRASDDLRTLARWAGDRAPRLAVLLEDDDRRTIRALVRGLAAAAPVEARVAAAAPTARLSEATVRALAEAPTAAALAEQLAALDHPYADAVRAGGEPVDAFAVELALTRRFAERARAGGHPALDAHVAQVIDGGNLAAALLLAERGEGVDVDACFLPGGERLSRTVFAAAAAGPPDEARSRLAAELAGTLVAGALTGGGAAALEEALLDEQITRQVRERRRDPTGPAVLILLVLCRRREAWRVRRAAWRLALGGGP